MKSPFFSRHRNAILLPILYVVLVLGGWLLLLVAGYYFSFSAKSEPLYSFSLILIVLFEVLIFWPYGLPCLILMLFGVEDPLFWLRQAPLWVYLGAPIIAQIILYILIGGHIDKQAQKLTTEPPRENLHAKTKRKRFLSWGELLVVVIFSSAVGLLLPVLWRARPELVNEGGDLMHKIYEKLESGYSAQQIHASFSNKERQMLDKHRISWLHDVLPIKTECGILDPLYVPIEHVVVYGSPEARLGREKIRLSTYIRWFGQPSHYESQEQLDKLIRTTRFGTSEILLGRVSNITDVPNVQDFDTPSLSMYLLLKNLMNNDKSYIQYAMQLASQKDFSVNDWVNRILSQSIVSPKPPILNPNYEDPFYDGWQEWYTAHADQIEFTNDFLFKETSSGE